MRTLLPFLLLLLISVPIDAHTTIPKKIFTTTQVGGPPPSRGPGGSQADTLYAHHQYQVGDSLHHAGLYDSATYHLRQAVNAYQQVQAQSRVALTLNRLSECYWRDAQYDSAEAVAQRALAQSKKVMDQAQAYYNLGTIRRNLEAYDSALVYYKKTIYTLGANQHSLTADAYNGLGNTYYITGDFQQAIAYYHQALSLRRKLYDSTHEKVGVSYNNLGVMYTKLKNYDSALVYQEKALTINLKNYGEGHPKTAFSYESLGNSYLDRGYIAKALTYYHNSLAIYQQVFGSNHANVISTYNNLGTAYQHQQSYDQALMYFNKALSIQQNTTATASLADILVNIGNVHLSRKNIPLAINHHLRALAIYQNLYGEEHPKVASTFYNLSLDYYPNLSIDSALYYAQKALTIREKIVGKDHSSVAACYGLMGIQYQSKKQYTRAHQCLTKALEINTTSFTGFHPAIGLAYLSLGKLFVEQADYSQGLAYIQQSINTYVPSFQDTSLYALPSSVVASEYLSNDLIDALHEKGVALYQYYQQAGNIKALEAALQTYVLNDQLMDQFRWLLQLQSDQVALVNSTRQVYQEAVDVCWALAEATQNNNYNKQAFYFAEKNKGLVLSETLALSGARGNAGLLDSIQQREETLRTDQAYYLSQLQQARIGQDTAIISQYEQALLNTQQRYSQLINELKRDYPHYYARKHRQNIPTISQIQAQLDDHTALVSYALGDSNMYTFLVTDQKLQAFRTPLTGEKHLIKTLRNSIVAQPSGAQYQSFVSSSYQLCQQLMGSVLPLLPTRTRQLIIVPDAELNYVPFELLLTTPVAASSGSYESLPYLLRDYTISYAYSAAWQFQPDYWPTISTQGCLAFAPSYQSFAQDTASWLAYNNARDQLRPLVWNQQEAKNAVQNISGKYVTGNQATEQEFKAEAAQYRILHLSMHALVDEEQPSNSKLIFTQQKDSLEDNLLYAHELYDMKIPADLVVLSACHTGVGKLEKGEGVMSLGRAFAYAGSPSIVMSHWAVEDQTTAQIMNSFYRYLSDGKPKNEALRQAKLDYLQQAEGRQTNPFLWAGLVLVGDDAPIILSKSNDWLTAGIIAILSISIIVIITIRSYYIQSSLQ